MKNMDKKKKRILIAASSLIVVLLISFTAFASMDNGKDLEEKVLGGNDTNITQEKDKAKAKDKTKVQQTEDTESKEEAAENKDEKSKTDTKKTTGSTAKSTSSSGAASSGSGSTGSSSGSQSSSSSSGSVSGGSGSSGGSTSSSGGSSSGSTGSSSGSGSSATPAPKPAHTHSYGGWNVDQSSGTKSRYCSCGASETVAATKVIDQAYQPGYYKTEYREEPNWVETWYVKDWDGNLHIYYSEEEAYNVAMSSDWAAGWGTGEDEQQGTISVPYEVWVPEVPEKYHWE